MEPPATAVPLLTTTTTQPPVKHRKRWPIAVGASIAAVVVAGVVVGIVLGSIRPRDAGIPATSAGNANATF